MLERKAPPCVVPSYLERAISAFFVSQRPREARSLLSSPLTLSGLCLRLQGHRGPPVSGRGHGGHHVLGGSASHLRAVRRRHIRGGGGRRRRGRLGPRRAAPRTRPPADAGLDVAVADVRRGAPGAERPPGSVRVRAEVHSERGAARTPDASPSLSSFQPATTTVTVATRRPAHKPRSGSEEMESEEEDEEDEENSEDSAEEDDSEEDQTETPRAPSTRPPYGLVPLPPVWFQRNQGLMRSWVELIREKAGYVSGCWSRWASASRGPC
ncbi:uncharacterized protein LOC119194851 [Pungitius pungitius]|uniref:uncharacterized protein LOC119194851 n=1 Tax=Pungitius pungitius TaxID=134920 RepID=UPI002E137DD3